MIPRIREVHLRNYRSIRQAVVHLSDFTVLVGPNGSGKSNFLDALAFVQECLSISLQVALRTRGGATQVRYGFSDSMEDGLGIRLVVELASDVVADYSFRLIWRDTGVVEVSEERCVISKAGQERQRFAVLDGQFTEPIPGVRPAIERDRLALYAASALPEFRPLYDFIVGMRVYSIQPGLLRDVRDPDSGLTLERHGENAAAVVRHLRENTPDRYRRVRNLLRAVVPGIDVYEGTTPRGGHFLLFVEGEDKDKDIPGLLLTGPSVSDGTLRILGLLLAAYQPITPTVLMIEEPEATIHPAAVDVVMSVLLDAAKRSQVVMTTHSPDVLDYKTLPEDGIRVVGKNGHGTTIAPVGTASREAIRAHLYSPGELLRADELNPDVSAAASLAEGTDLFGKPVHSFEGAD